MSAPRNQPYQRRFARPQDRPSNQAPVAGFDYAAATRERIRELHLAIDRQDGAALVSGAEAWLAQEVRRRWADEARREGWKQGEPGA